MAKGKRTGKGHALRYTAYKQNKTYEMNRKRRLARALKRNPENTQIESVMSGIVWRRSTPANREWSSTKRRIAELFKEFNGKVDKDIFHSNEKVSAAALAKYGPNAVRVKTEPDRRSMFSIGVRIA